MDRRGIMMDHLSNVVRCKAILVVAMMSFGIFVGLNALGDEARTVEGRALTDAPAVNHTLKVAWSDGDLIRYYDMGLTTNQTMPVYLLRWDNGTDVPQFPIIRYIPDGIFNEYPGDLEYAHIGQFHLVEVPSASYQADDATSYDDIDGSGYTITPLPFYACGRVVSNGTQFVNYPGFAGSDDIDMVDLWWNGSNVHLVGMYGPDNTTGFIDSTTGEVNISYMFDVKVNGSKHLAKAAYGDAGFSPFVNITEIFVPNGTVTDTYRNYTEMAQKLGAGPGEVSEGDSELRLLWMFGTTKGPDVFEHAAPVLYEKQEAWVDGEIVHYYDLGEVTGNYSRLYTFVFENDSEVGTLGQWAVLVNVSGDAFVGKGADEGYSPFARIYNVTLPDGFIQTYGLNYINSYEVIEMLALSIEETDVVVDVPVVPKGSTLEDTPFDEAGPHSMWYNMQEVNVLSFHEDYAGGYNLYDPVADGVRSMDAAIIDISGQRPVIEHHNGSVQCSPLWEATSIVPPQGFIEDGVRNMTSVDDLLDAGVVNTTGLLLNRPLAGGLRQGPPIFQALPPKVIQAETGWYDGDHVMYYDLSASDDVTGPIYVLYYENASDDNGTKVPGQRPIIEDIPVDIFVGNDGDNGYTGLWNRIKVVVPQDYEANTAKSLTDIQDMTFPLEATEMVMAAPVLPAGSELAGHPDGQTELVQVWYEANPAYTLVLDDEMDPATYNASTFMVRTNRMYGFYNVSGQSPIFDEHPSDVQNHTYLWDIVNVSTPDTYMADDVRASVDIEALLTAGPGNGFTSTVEGIRLIEIAGDVNKTGVPPQARAGIDVTTKQTFSVTFDGSDSTDNVGLVSWTWSFVDNGTVVILDGMITSFVFEHIDVIEVTLTVKDGEGLEDTDTMVVTVLDGLSPVAKADGEDLVEAGDVAVFNGSGSTDNVGITQYEWDFGDNTTGSGIVVNHTFTVPGTYNVTLNVSDAEGNWAVDTITVVVLTPNEPPVVNGIPDQEVIAGTTFTYQVVASDPDGDALEYSLVQYPLGMYINNTGRISFLVPSSFGGLDLTVEVMVSDGRANVSTLFILSVKVPVIENITTTLGPFKDKNGDPVKGVLVEIYYGSEYFNGTTDNLGKVSFTVPGTWSGAWVEVKVSKEGYKTKEFTGAVGEDGTFLPSGGKYPTIERALPDIVPDYKFLVLAIIIFLALILVLVFMKRPPDEEDEWKDEGLVKDEGTEGGEEDEEDDDEDMEDEEGVLPGEEE